MARLMSWASFRTSPNQAQRKGSVAVEFALISPAFFLLLMGFCELCLMEGAQQLIENAAYNTSRLAKTGYVESGMSQEQTVNQLLVSKLSSFGSLIDTSRVETKAANFNNFSSSYGEGGASGYGTAQQIVVYTISYKWVIFTPMMCSALGNACTVQTVDGTDKNVVNLISTIVVRNEPYSTS